jgi:hypothetical protein
LIEIGFARIAMAAGLREILTYGIDL